MSRYGALIGFFPRESYIAMELVLWLTWRNSQCVFDLLMETRVLVLWLGVAQAGTFAKFYSPFCMRYWKKNVESTFALSLTWSRISLPTKFSTSSFSHPPALSVWKPSSVTVWLPLVATTGL